MKQSINQNLGNYKKKLFLNALFYNSIEKSRTLFVALNKKKAQYLNHHIDQLMTKLVVGLAIRKWSDKVSPEVVIRQIRSNSEAIILQIGRMTCPFICDIFEYMYDFI